MAQFAVCSETNTKHINTVWAERTVKTFNLLVHHVTSRLLKVKQDEGYPSNTTILNILFLLVYFNQATCFDPLKLSSSGRGIIKVLSKS
jgi:hypothetical protein